MSWLENRKTVETTHHVYHWFIAPHFADSLSLIMSHNIDNKVSCISSTKFFFLPLPPFSHLIYITFTFDFPIVIYFPYKYHKIH